MDEEDTNESRFSPEEEEQLKKAFEELEDLQNRTTPEPYRRKAYYYKLDINKKVVPCSMYDFSLQVQDPESCRIGETQLGPYHISTVFLMLNHGFGGKDQFFETMIWSDKDPHAEYKFYNRQWRYETYEEALKGHEAIVTLVREGVLP